VGPPVREICLREGTRTKPSAKQLCQLAAAAIAADGCGTDGGGWELAGKPPGGLVGAPVREICLPSSIAPIVCLCL
jgi:hypothetical protein